MAEMLEPSEFCFLNIYKPKGITSFDVVFKLRKRLGIKKIGHAGTLDPLAEGVMQVGVGKAARLLDYLGSDKKYIATIKFGYSSTTLDAEGEITEAEAPKFTFEELQTALNSFIGETEQTPPIYSAIKVGGKKLCDVARKGKETEIEIPKRKIKIYEAKILTPKDASKEEIYGALKIEVSCSKGTYIRTLAQDLALKLGTSAYLTGLVRTQAGNFKIEDSVQIDEVDINLHNIRPQNALNLTKYELDASEYQKVLNGLKIAPEASCLKNFKQGEPVALIFQNYLVSIAVLSDNMFKVKKVFKA